jgi:hypothetical protein
VLDPEKGDCPRAVFYTENIPETFDKAVEFWKSLKDIPEEELKRLKVGQDPGKWHYIFYSERAYGTVKLVWRHEKFLEGVLDLSFKPNMINNLGLHSVGTDVPDWGDFTIRGKFVIPRYGSAEKKEKN